MAGLVPDIPVFRPKNATFSAKRGVRVDGRDRPGDDEESTHAAVGIRCGKLIASELGEKQMNIYRLDPIDPNDPSWRNSVEKECVWAGAPTPNDARKLVADKTRPDAHGAAGLKSPWQDEALTSCVWEPSMTHIRAGAVVRADGSLVGD
ncbi:MAG: hypothetical protein ABSE69_06790 [Roseiarcus sp.]|jgi:hypothetical protein